jgi:hypothetical protein
VLSLELETFAARLLNMRGQLQITRQFSDVYQASVVAAAIGRGWSKQYSSKPECLTELCLLGLISSADQNEISHSEFNAEHRTMLFDASIIPIALVGADFVEITPAQVN